MRRCSCTVRPEIITIPTFIYQGFYSFEKGRVEKVYYLINNRVVLKYFDFNPNIRNSFCVSPHFNYLIHDIHYLDESLKLRAESLTRYF